MAEKPGLITGIGAVASNGMLGLNGWLPWDIPEELAYFERTVEGAALLIGRLTYESMDVVPVDSFIVSRQQDMLVRAGCVRVASVEEGLLRALATGKPVFVIGGASIYEAAWPYCHQFLLTRIEMPFAGDSLFPDSIQFDQWDLISENEQTYIEQKTGNPVRCRFVRYQQKAPRPLPKLQMA